MSPRFALSFALLAALLAAGPAPATARGVPTMPAAPAGTTPPTPEAAAFDRLFDELDRGDLATAPAQQAQERLARLRRLLPPGDAARDLQYRYLACLRPQADPRVAVELASRGLVDARGRGDAHAEVRFLLCRARHRTFVAAPQASLPDMEAALELARAQREWRLLADGLVGRGHVRSVMGEHARALNDFLTARQLYRSSGHEDLARDGVFDLGVAYRRMGEYDKALVHLQAAHDHALASGDAYTRVHALLQQGYLYDEQGQPMRAREAFERALGIARRAGARGQVGSARLALAGAHIGQRQYPEALAAVDLAAADLAAVNDGSSTAMVLLRRGQALAGLDRHDEALREFDAAEARMQADGNLRYLPLLLPARSLSHEALGRPGPALRDFRRFLDAQQRLLESMAAQRTAAMRHQYDASRREVDTQRLLADTAARRRELDALVQARRWQWLALALGVALVLVLLARVLRQQWRSRRLRTAALTDELTGVANRRGIEAAGVRALAAARRGDRPLTVLMIDIDRFKQVNDVHGHLVGDEVLRRVAVACQHGLRQADRLGRSGGEEFLAVLPGTDPAAGVQVAERLRDAVRALDLHDIAPGLRTTISLGAATLRASDEGFEALVDRADQALYRAKTGGRDRVECDGPV